MTSSTGTTPRIHVGTHTLHYGTGVFEGIRAYETSQGPAVFRLTDHIVRLHNSAKILGHVDPVHGRRAGRGHQGDGGVDRSAGVLRAPDRVLRLRRDGPQHDAVLGRRGDHVLAVGCLSRRRRAHRRACASRPRRGRVTTTTSCRRRRRPPATTSTRRSPRSRRSRPATTRRSCSPATVSSPSAPARTCSCRATTS